MALLLAIEIVLSSCASAPAVVRVEGRPLEPAPRDTGRSTTFTGEGRGRDRGEAIQLAELDARRQALESIRVRIRSEVEQRITTTRLDDAISLDEKAQIEVTSLAEGALEGSRGVGEPYVRFYDDGSVLAQASIVATKESLDPGKFLEALVTRQALEHRMGGRIDKAIAAFWALSQLRPTDPMPFFHLGRSEEQRGDLPRALESMKQARQLNGDRRWLEVPGEGRIDLESEVDRLTPHWDNLLAELARFEEAAGEPANFSIRATQDRVSRAESGVVHFRLWSKVQRPVALLWIDDDGLESLPALDGSAAGAFSDFKGSQTLEQDIGTLNGPVRLVAISVSSKEAKKVEHWKVGRQALQRRDPEAVLACRQFRDLLEAEARAGTLRVGSARFDILP